MNLLNLRNFGHLGVTPRVAEFFVLTMEICHLLCHYYIAIDNGNQFMRGIWEVLTGYLAAMWRKKCNFAVANDCQ